MEIILLPLHGFIVEWASLFCFGYLMLSRFCQIISFVALLLEILKLNFKRGEFREFSCLCFELWSKVGYRVVQSWRLIEYIQVPWFACSSCVHRFSQQPVFLQQFKNLLVLLGHWHVSVPGCRSIGWWLILDCGVHRKCGHPPFVAQLWKTLSSQNTCWIALLGAKFALKCLLGSTKQMYMCPPIW